MLPATAICSGSQFVQRGKKFFAINQSAPLLPNRSRQIKDQPELG
jgi:hypothetical protein